MGHFEDLRYCLREIVSNSDNGLQRSICIFHLCQRSLYTVYGCLCLHCRILIFDTKLEQKVNPYVLLFVFR